MKRPRPLSLWTRLLNAARDFSGKFRPDARFHHLLSNFPFASFDIDHFRSINDFFVFLSLSLSLLCETIFFLSFFSFPDEKVLSTKLKMSSLISTRASRDVSQSGVYCIYAKGPCPLSQLRLPPPYRDIHVVATRKTRTILPRLTMTILPPPQMGR